MNQARRTISSFTPPSATIFSQPSEEQYCVDRHCMAPEHRQRPVPCLNCREKHAKCDGRKPCANCQKTNSPCFPARKQRPLRFKHVIPDGASSTHRVGQAEASSQFYDKYGITQVHQAPTKGSLAEAAIILQTLASRPSGNPEANQDPIVFDSPGSASHETDSAREPNSPELGRRPLTVTQTPSSSSRGEQPSQLPDISHSSEQDEPPFINSIGTSASELDSSCPGNSIQRLELLDNESIPGFQEACLVRCFVENLADAFDTTDQHRAYKTIVPQEARKRPLLLNAICTATASYLTILQSTQNSEGVVSYNGIPLPHLNKESTIHYHNACISYMIDYLNNPRDLFEDVLIAIPILRYHEQVDVRLIGSDPETYSNALEAIFRAKQSSFTTLLSAIGNSGPSLRASISKELALRRSACLIALRQEISGVLRYRRPLRLSLPGHYYSDLALSQNDNYDDYDWTNHILIWCAYVLKQYYGSEVDSDITEDSVSRDGKWQSLKAFERQWTSLTPNPLSPFYHKERDPENGQFFPIIWQANDGRVIGMQHIEFGRIILTVHELKDRILGVGAAAAARAIEWQLRKSTRIICGLALSHRIQAAMTSACTAISLCGEYFRDPKEQAAIVDLMETIEREYAWSTSPVMDSLRRAWSSSRRNSADSE